MSFAISVAKYRSFTKAAVENNTVQANISRQVQALEDELSVRLFVRTKRTVEITTPGEIIISTFARIIDSLEEAKIQVQDIMN